MPIKPAVVSMRPMTRFRLDLHHLLPFLTAAVLALTLWATAREARSDGFDGGRSVPAGPRWSNDHHHLQGTIVGPGCVLPSPDYQAGYVAGRDAWEHPVIPAETPQHGQALPLAVELDVLLAQKQIAGRDLNLSATAPLDIAPRAGGAWSGPGPQDCFPAFK